MIRRAIYPGSFDPVTNGHLDIIQRASKIFDELIVAIAVNIVKAPMFTLEERMEMIRTTCRDLPNVRVGSFDSLTVRYAKSQEAQTIVRGLRAISDFEYEFEMALMNRGLDPNIETVFMMPSAEYSYLRASIIKEVAGLGGSVEGLVPAIAEDYLNKKLKR